MLNLGETLFVHPNAGALSICVRLQLRTKQLCVSTAVKLHQVVATTCRNILAVVGPPGSGKSAMVAAMSGRLYKPAKVTGRIVISGRETYEAFRPTWFSANDVLTSHLTVHQYLLYKGKVTFGC